MALSVDTRIVADTPIEVTVWKPFAQPGHIVQLQFDGLTISFGLSDLDDPVAAIDNLAWKLEELRGRTVVAQREQPAPAVPA